MTISIICTKPYYSLIGSGHTDAATIAQWKDGLNDSWADLGELIDTRTQMLEASRELHKYFHDCKDVLGRIFEKKMVKCRYTERISTHCNVYKGN